MKKLCSVFLLLLTGCAGSYDSYMRAYTNHVDKETERVKQQSTQIVALTQTFAGTKTEEALMRAFGVIAIGQLEPIPFTLPKPTQWEDVGLSLANQATGLMSWGMAAMMVKWGFENTGTTFNGDTYLENSMNRQGLNAYSGSPVMNGMAPGPEPVIVEPTVVIP